MSAKFKSPAKWGVSVKETADKSLVSVPVIVFRWIITFFQTYISPMDGPRCQLYPTCSEYGKRAIVKNGPIVGYFMAADRLMRDNSGVSQNYPLVKIGEHYYYYDP